MRKIEVFGVSAGENIPDLHSGNIVFAGKRLLKDVPGYCRKVELKGDWKNVMRELLETTGANDRIVVLGSGDPLFHGIGGALLREFTECEFSFTPQPAAFQLLAACMLFLLFIAAQQPIIAVLGMTLCTMCLFGVSSPQQFLLLKNAPGGELLGAISAQIAFNLGNAFGAYLGGIPLKHGFPPTACAAVGIPLTLTGFTLLMLFNRVTKKTQP